jgi:hypothetical protein
MFWTRRRHIVNNVVGSAAEFRVGIAAVGPSDAPTG